MKPILDIVELQVKRIQKKEVRGGYLFKLSKGAILKKSLGNPGLNVYVCEVRTLGLKFK